MAAGERCAPGGDPGWVDALKRRDVGDRGVPILVLALHVDELPRLAGAGPEMTVVEDKRREAGVSEPFGECPQAVLSCTRQTVREHDTGLGVWAERGR